MIVLSVYLVVNKCWVSAIDVTSTRAIITHMIGELNVDNKKWSRDEHILLWTFVPLLLLWTSDNGIYVYMYLDLYSYHIKDARTNYTLR